MPLNTFSQDKFSFNFRGIGIRLPDLFVLLFILFFAFCIEQGLWLGTAQGTYNPFKSDVEEYSGRLASEAYPENFKNDPMYGANSWTTNFFTLQTWLGKTFPAGDNFNWACMRQTAPCVIIFYSGFYLLGLFLFKSRAVALLLMLAMALPDDVGWGTFWGILAMPTVPRLIFDTAVPWLLMLAFLSFRHQYLRPLVMLICGALSSAHTISALGLGGAFFFAYICIKGENCSWTRYFLTLLLSLLCFFLPLLPYIWATMANKNIDAENMRFFLQMFNENFRLRFGPPFEDFGKFLWRYTFKRPLLPLAAIGGCLALLYGDREKRAILKICLLWMAGLFLCGVCLSFLEQAIAEKMSRISVFHQMIRITRFYIPIFYIIMGAGLAAVFMKMRRSIRVPIFVLLLLTLFPLCYISLGQLTAYASYYVQHSLGIKNWFTDQFDKQVELQSRRREAMLAIKEKVPAGSMVFSNSGDPAVRYLGLRSLAHTFTDGAHLFFRRDAEGCRNWLEVEKKLKEPGGYLDAWKNSSAAYLLTDSPEDWQGPQDDIVWRNSHYLLIRKDDKL